MHTTPSFDEKCPVCEETVPAPVGKIGPGSFVGDASDVPQLDREIATCAKCGATLSRPLLGGPHPWERVPDTPN